MSEQLTLSAEARDRAGKGASRHLRREGRVPAVVLIKNMIDEGKLGRIFHYRAKFLQDWTIAEDLPQGGEGLWRLDVKVAGSGDRRIEALRLADIYKANVVDATLSSFIFELVGTTEHVEEFIALMSQLGMVETSRTGVLAMSKGAAGF